MPVHGTLSRAACEACGGSAPIDDFCAAVRANVKDIYGTDASAPAQSTNIRCASCGKPTVKPTTVLFGGSLPDAFFRRPYNSFIRIIIVPAYLCMYAVCILARLAPFSTPPAPPKPMPHRGRHLSLH